MSKYEPLEHYLKSQTGNEVRMRFQDVERVLGGRLPPSAYRHRPWWANEAAGHVHAKAWLNAGYTTEQVDMEGKKLVFKKIGSAAPAAGLNEEGRAFAHDTPRVGRHPLIGAMKGTFTIEEGYDLTQPAMPEWADIIDEKYGKEVSRK
jgi:hypothetical protein